jgi:hypothetical protein
MVSCVTLFPVQITGFSTALEWLEDNLRNEADDREAEDSWEHLPIVPVREYARQAVKDPIFVHLLKSLGLTPPQTDKVTTPTKIYLF